MYSVEFHGKVLFCFNFVGFAELFRIRHVWHFLRLKLQWYGKPILGAGNWYLGHWIHTGLMYPLYSVAQ